MIIYPPHLLHTEDNSSEKAPTGVSSLNLMTIGKTTKKNQQDEILLYFYSYLQILTSRTIDPRILKWVLVIECTQTGKVRMKLKGYVAHHKNLILEPEQWLRITYEYNDQWTLISNSRGTLSNSLSLIIW